MLNNFATTVQTPRKCPGRDLPSSVFEREDSSTNTDRSSAYISATLGRNKRSTPAFRQNSSSIFSKRGYSCDRNFSIQLARQDHASQKRRMLEWQKALHRNASSARGKSA